MRKSLILMAAASATLLSACGSTGLFNRNRPDEYAVTRAAPLIIPPDFALAPPQPGAPAATTETAAEQTLQALFGGPAPRSATEISMLNRAGVARAEAGIRSVVGDPGTFTVNKGTVTRDILAAPAGAGQFSQAVAGTPTGG
ncbi:MAG: DUF3035 domain-containing protein [Pseudomonadota bacterium]